MMEGSAILCSTLRAALMLALLAATAACVNDPEKINKRMREIEPAALQAAKERAQLYFNCSGVSVKTLSSDHGGMDKLYGLRRSVYKVDARGCGQHTVFTVACGDEGDCSALAESADIERTQ